MLLYRMDGAPNVIRVSP